jgi:hypothetical protein
MSKCGLCGSSNIHSGSWISDKCRDCGAVEGPEDWYHEDSDVKDLSPVDIKQSWLDAIRNLGGPDIFDGNTEWKSLFEGLMGQLPNDGEFIFSAPEEPEKEPETPRDSYLDRIGYYDRR